MSLAWAYQATLPNGTDGAPKFLMGVVSDHGTTIAAFNNLDATPQTYIYRSTNGGVTWSLQEQGSAGGTPPLGVVLYVGNLSGNKTWIVGVDAQGIYKSTDDGQTWAFTPVSFFRSSCGASDGNGYCVFSEANNGGLYASINGATPTAYSGPFFDTYSIIWDGTQFVAIARDSAGRYRTFTAPTGWTVGAGPVWTEGGTSLAAGFLWGAGWQTSCMALCYASGIGYMANSGLNTTPYPTTVVGSSIIGMAGATPIVVENVTAASINALCPLGPNLIVAGDSTGAKPLEYTAAGGWVSNSGFTFHTAGSSVAAAVFDSVNGNYILLSHGGPSNGSDVYISAVLSITPPSVTLADGASQSFTANLSGTSWSAINGYIDSSGNYVAPPSGASDTVTATLTGQVANAAVTLVAQSATINPPLVTVNYGAQTSFGVTTNPPAMSVVWSCLYGSITQSGLYSAPATPGGPTTDTVTVALAGNPAAQSSATVTLGVPTITVRGKFAAAPKLNGPSVLANVGNITPKIYMPAENTTVKA